MEQTLKTELKNLSEKLDTIGSSLSAVESKVDKIADKQAEQNIILGEHQVKIAHNKEAIDKHDEEHTHDIDTIWAKFRDKEKFMSGLMAGLIITIVGFFANLFYMIVGKK